MFKVPVEISARHVHLSQEHLTILFGSDYQLNKLKDISQPGEFSCQETLILKTDKAEIKNVRIVGPLRKQTQAEISLTDARNLGIRPPIRISGDLTGSEKCSLIGPAGMIDLTEGVIVAQRHLHLDPVSAQENKLKNKEIVSVLVNSKNRAITFHQVMVRVSPNFKNSFHLDTDEGNAAGLRGGEQGIVIKNEFHKDEY
ncbi:MAG: phosphate propanoyltransferase [Patescibacteria group bacterium]|jgi:putative phosphotransacetylase|nr:phosphate propanoyltransferase [Patescibacteria group bacterium]MDD5172651.1 phosphate propanoyltransferase [Patescibacteria group bacterium]